MELVLNDPLKGRGELIEEIGGTMQTEGKGHIEEIQALPPVEGWTGMFRKGALMASLDIKQF